MVCWKDKTNIITHWDAVQLTKGSTVYIVNQLSTYITNMSEQSFHTYADRWLQHLDCGHKTKIYCWGSSQAGLQYRDTTHHTEGWDQFPGQRRHL